MFDASSTALIVGLIALASATVQGFTGFGFGLVGMAACTLLVGPRDGNVLWALLTLVVVGGILWRLRRHVQWELTVMLLAGSVLGLPIGIHLLESGSEDFLRRAVGAAILLFGGYSLFNPQFDKLDVSSLWALPAGGIAGFFSGLTSMGGPAAVIFLLLKGLAKEKMKGTLAGYFMLNAIIKVALLGATTKLMTMQHVGAAAMFALPAVIGIGAGLYGASRVSTRTMRRCVCGFLFVPGCMLLFG